MTPLFPDAIKGCPSNGPFNATPPLLKSMRLLIILLTILTPLSLHSAPVPVTVDARTGMTRGGEPYFVKGAGGETRLPALAERGANSLRTWSTDNLAKTLEEAQELGLTVSAGIWLEPECSWFSYGAPEDCAKQSERVRQQVMQYREHPALLAWGLGNEAEGDGTNAAYWQQLETLTQMVKQLDPAHPTFTAVAGLSAEKAQGLNEHTPSLDYVGVNTYGGLFRLREHLAEIGWERPWLVTEWGPHGFWERPKSTSGAPLEQTSTEKAAMMRSGYEEVIAPGGACLGSYVFLWDWKFEATSTWFGLFTHEGEMTESVDVLEEKWSGQKPSNLAPKIQPMTDVPIKPIEPGASFTARAEATDPDGDALVWRWSVLAEKTTHDAGQRPRMPDAIKGAIVSTEDDRAQIKAPSRPGVYRLHVWISDGHDHAATANVPFEVR